MNQTFKQKLLVASVAAAFVVAGGFSTVAAANTFSDTSISNTNSTGAKVPVSATAAVSGITVAYTEALPASIVTSSSTANVLRLQLSAGKIVSGTVTFSGGFNVTAPGASGNSATASNVSPGYSTITISGTTADGSVTVNYMKADGTVGSTSFATNATLATTTANLKAALVAAGFATADVTDSGTAVTIATGKGAFLALSGTVTDTFAVSNLGAYGVDSNGVMSIPVVAQSSATAGKISLSSLVINTSSVAVGTAVNLNVAQAPSGVTAANSTTIANVSSSAVTAALVTTGTELQTVDGVLTGTLPSFKLSETFAGDIGSNQAIKVDLGIASFDSTTGATLAFSGGAVTTPPAANADTAVASAVTPGYSVVTLGGTVTGGTITVNYMKGDGSVGSTTFTGVTSTAASGAALKAALVAAGFATADITDSGAGVVTIGAGKGAFLGLSGTLTGTAPTAAVSSLLTSGLVTGGKLYIPIATKTSSSAAVITVSAAKANVAAGTAAGDINATFTGTVGSGSATSAIKVGSVVAKGTSLAIKDTNSPVKGVNTIYLGRATEAPFPTGVSLRFTESAPATLVNGSIYSLTLSAGKFAAVPTSGAAGNGAIFGTFTKDTTGAVATATVTTQSTTATTTDYNDLLTSSASIDLSAVTSEGDLNVTAGGNSSVTSQVVKIATLKKATAASVSGTAPTTTAGGTVTLPDLIITESKAGAIGLSTKIGIEIPTSDIILASGATATSGATLTTTGTSKDVTVTITDANGQTYTPAGVASYNGGGTSVNQLLITMPGTASTSTTGVFTVKVSGLKVKTTTSAVAGDIQATVGSCKSGNATAITGGEAASTWDSTCGVYKQTAKVAAIVGATTPSYPTATVTDSTKAVIAGLPLVAAGNDQGKPGAVYVAVVYQGNVFFLSSTGTWSQFTSAATVPAYFTGTLGTTTLDIVKTALDLTPIKGAQIVAGYGLGIAGLSSPFDDFIKNARYNVVYTVQ